jgi:hypothetical protein
VSRAPGICATYANSSGIGEKTVPSTSSISQSTLNPTQQTNNEAPKVLNDKYNLYFVLSDDTENTVDSEFENCIAQVRFFEKLEVNSNRASDFIIDTIQNGYVIPF